MLTPNIYVKFEREKYLTLLQIQTSNHRRIEITLKKKLREVRVGLQTQTTTKPKTFYPGKWTTENR